MNISLEQASEILGKSQDELMFLVQIDEIQAGVDQDTLAWEFKLDDVLKLKAELEKAEAEEKAEDDS